MYKTFNEFVSDLNENKLDENFKKSKTYMTVDYFSVQGNRDIFNKQKIYGIMEIGLKKVLPSYLLKDTTLEDISTEKGIKFIAHIKETGDILHIYKTNNVLNGGYEYYLNQKLIGDENQAKEVLYDKYDYTSFKRYIQDITSHDRGYNMGNNRVYDSGYEHANFLKNLYSELNNTEKKKAYKAYMDYFNIKPGHAEYVEFNEFSGVTVSK